MPRRLVAILLQTGTTVIDAERPLSGLNPFELWEYRDLFLVLIQRDLKLRYRQTFLGVVWAVLQPVLPMIVFSLLFGRLAHMPADGLPYPIFVYAGLLPWTFFNTAVTSATVERREQRRLRDQGLLSAPAPARFLCVW